MVALPLMTAKADINWIGPTADYTNAADWSGGVVPGPTNDAANFNGSNNVVQINVGDPDWTVTDIAAGGDSNGGGANSSGAITQNGQTLTVNGWLHVGSASNSVGIFTLNNGTVNVPTGPIFLGEGPGSTSVLNINGGTINYNNGGNQPIHIADGGWNGNYARTGTVNQVNGSFNDANSELWIGQANLGYGVYNLSGGSLNVGNWVAIGRAGAQGFLNMTGGTFTKTGGGDFLIGTGGIGYMNQTGGVLNVNGGLMRVGDGSTGVYNLAGGSVNDGSDLWIGQSGTGNGTLNLSGTAAFTNSTWLAIGREGATGVLNIYGGTMVVNTGNSGENISICHGSGASGTVNQSGGTFINVNGQTWIGEDSGTGTWNMTNGISIHNQVNIAENPSASGLLNLVGGTFAADGINGPNPGSTTGIFFNGGTLQARTNNSSFVSGLYTAVVYGGGAVIDSQAYNIAIPQDLVDGGGGLTKLGTGTLSLTGTNTYTGDTIVNAGTLTTGTFGNTPGNLTVADNASFGIIVGSAGAQYGAAGVTLGSSTGASLSFNLGGFGNPSLSQAPLNVTGTLTKNGTTTIYIADSLPQIGDVPLIHYATLAGSGNFVIGSLPTGVTANIFTNGSNNSIDLNISVVNQPRWEGLAGGNWDIGITTNWINLGTGLPTYYGNGVPVLFNDSALGTTTVNLTTTVNPYSVTVTNNSLNYTFVGSGSISGSTGLSKQGSDTLNILNNNGYTGPTVISGGVLNVTNLANGGSPSPLGASSSNPTNLVIGAGTLEFSGTPVTVDRGFTANAAGATIDAENNLTLGGQVASGSTAGIVKIGPAQLALTATGNNQLGNNFDPGTQVQQGTLLLDGSAGGQTNHNFNEMWIGCTPTSGGALILTNTTLNVDNWVGLGRINGGINNTSSITLYNSALTCGNLSLGWDGGLGGNLSSQFITLNGASTFTDNGNVNLPEGANASMTLTVNGSSTFWVNNPVYICKANNTTGSVVVANSGKFIQANGWFDVGEGNNCVASVLVKDSASLSLDGDCNLGDTATASQGTITIQDSATLTANNLFVGKSANNVCTFNVAGSATGSFGDFMRLADGSSSTGNVNISGGSLTFNQYMNMAGGSGSTASVTMTGGSLTGGNDMTVGDQATATVTMNGGVLTVPNTLYLSRGNGVADGTVNLNTNGTIVCGNINNGWAFNAGTNSPTFNPNAFNFNGGTLKSYGANGSYIFPNVNTVVQAGGAIINDNGYTVEFGAALVSGGGGGGLTKLGNGTLRLDGVNTFTGATLVSAGTLCGFETFAGPVNVAAGATLAPGITTAIGTLTINNSLTFSNSSTALLKISLTGGVTNNDLVNGLTGVNYGGTLVVTNSGASPLVVGAQFQLFAAGGHTGNFVNAASVAIQPVGTGSFDPNTGKLTITSSGAFVFNPTMVSGGNLILSGSGGVAGNGYTWLTSTNLTIPVASWTTNTTGIFSGTGTFSNAIPIIYTTPAQFFRLRTP